MPIPTCPTSDCPRGNHPLTLSRDALGNRTWHCPSCDYVEDRNPPQTTVSYSSYAQEVFVADGTPAYPAITA